MNYTIIIFRAIPMPRAELAQSIHHDPQVVFDAFDAGAVTMGPDRQYYYFRIRNGGPWPPLDLETQLEGHKLYSYCDGLFGIWYTNNIGEQA